MEQLRAMPRKPAAGIQSTVSSMDNEYYRITTVVTIFKLFGLAPWDVERTSPGKNGPSNKIFNALRKPRLAYSRLGCVYQIVFVVVTTYVWILKLYSYFVNGSEYPNKSPLTEMLALIMSISSNIIVIGIRIKLCIQQDKVVKLFNRYARIDDNVRRSANVRYSESNGLFFVMLLSFNTLPWAVIILTNKQCFGEIFDTMFISILPSMGICWFMTQYVIAIKLIELRLRDLNRDLVDVPNFTGIRSIPSLMAGDNSIDPANRPKIIAFRRNHTELYEIACDISEFYSLTILISIAHVCFTVIYGAYYLVIPVVSQVGENSPWIVINTMGALISNALPIVMLAAGTEGTNSELRKTANVVHRLIAGASTSPEDKSQLRRFSLEVLQREVEFSAYGLFSLDRTLLHSIFSTTVTYLIIMIQFQLAGEKKSV